MKMPVDNFEKATIYFNGLVMPNMEDGSVSVEVAFWCMAVAAKEFHINPIDLRNHIHKLCQQIKRGEQQ